MPQVTTYRSYHKEKIAFLVLMPSWREKTKENACNQWKAYQVGVPDP